jgi:ADP-ribose pyrophosphatase YjhB (NUDIX family)
VNEQNIRVAVDIVVLTIHENTLKVLLIRRGIPPFQNSYALPGGFVRDSESLEKAALRELSEETGTEDVYLEQLYSFGEPKRDPRGRVVSVAYYALISADKAPLIAGTDAAEARWFSVNDLPKLAFDHAEIVEYSLNRLRNKLEYTSVGFQLLPRKFTLSELQHVYEVILGKELDKRNFRRKIDALDVLKSLREMQATGRKPARLFMFRTGDRS